MLAGFTRTPELRRADVRGGARLGAQWGLGLGVLALAIGAARAYAADLGVLPVGFALVVGTGFVAVGTGVGALYGALKPLGRTLSGRLVLTYLILFAVYGAGTLLVRPLIDEPRPHVLGMLAFVALFCLPLAPAYVAMIALIDRFTG